MGEPPIIPSEGGTSLGDWLRSSPVLLVEGLVPSANKNLPLSGLIFCVLLLRVVFVFVWERSKEESYGIILQ